MVDDFFHSPALCFCRYHTDPSGTYTQYLAKAIGSGSEGATTSLQEQYNKSMDLQEAKKLALEVLKQVMEEKLSSTNVEMAIVTKEDPTFRLLTREEIETLIGELKPDVV